MFPAPVFDVHHHVLLPGYVAALERIGQSQSGSAAIPQWNLQSTIDLMDRLQIATAVASVSLPGVYFGDELLARDLAQRCNEFVARLIGDHPGRFGALAILPLPDVEDALTELAYSLDTLHLDGVILQASVGKWYQGAPAFEALYRELDRRKAVVLLHLLPHRAARWRR
jgi:hypothetical protein